jgi:hypothetical protein
MLLTHVHTILHKTCFLRFLQMYWKLNTEIYHLHKYSHAFAITLQIELRCIQFTLIILEMSQQLDWSPPVTNNIFWTWFRKKHTCLHWVFENIRNTFLILSCTHFRPQNSLASSGHGLYKVSKAFHRDAGPRWLHNPSTVVSRSLDALWVLDHSWYTWETVEHEKPDRVAVLDTCLNCLRAYKSFFDVSPPLHLHWRVVDLTSDFSKGS